MIGLHEAFSRSLSLGIFVLMLLITWTARIGTFRLSWKVLSSNYHKQWFCIELTARFLENKWWKKFVSSFVSCCKVCLLCTEGPGSILHITAGKGPMNTFLIMSVSSFLSHLHCFVDQQVLHQQCFKQSVLLSISK